MLIVQYCKIIKESLLYLVISQVFLAPGIRGVAISNINQLHFIVARRLAMNINNMSQKHCKQQLSLNKFME